MGKIHSALYRVNYRWLFYLQREGPLGGKTTCLGPCPPALDISCVFSHSVMSSCLPPHGGRLLRPWDSPCENTAVGCHFLLQGIFLTQGSNPHLLHCREILYPPNHPYGEQREHQFPLADYEAQIKPAAQPKKSPEHTQVGHRKAITNDP